MIRRWYHWHYTRTRSAHAHTQERWLMAIFLGYNMEEVSALQAPEPRGAWSWFDGCPLDTTHTTPTQRDCWPPSSEVSTEEVRQTSSAFVYLYFLCISPAVAPSLSSLLSTCFFLPWDDKHLPRTCTQIPVFDGSSSSVKNKRSPNHTHTKSPYIKRKSKWICHIATNRHVSKVRKHLSVTCHTPNRHTLSQS